MIIPSHSLASLVLISVACSGWRHFLIIVSSNYQIGFCSFVWLFLVGLSKLVCLQPARQKIAQFDRIHLKMMLQTGYWFLSGAKTFCRITVTNCCSPDRLTFDPKFAAASRISVYVGLVKTWFVLTSEVISTFYRLQLWQHAQHKLSFLSHLAF